MAKAKTLPNKIVSYLKKNQAKYDELVHKTVYTAYDAAQTLKKELKDVAKNLLVKADGTYALIVVPADKRLDLKKIKKALGAKKVSIPNESLMVKVLKIKPGVLSSFGKLHKVETWIDKAMLKTKQVVLSTGSATNSVLMKVKDFVALEEAKIADLSGQGNYQLAKPTKKSAKKKPTAKKTAGKKSSVKKSAKKRAVKKPVRKTTRKKK